MLPLNPASYLFPALKDQTTEGTPANEDYAFHLSHLRASTPDPLYLRLLPRVIRTPLKAYLEARAYERMLVRAWEISPHLLDDMGVVVDPGEDMPDHLIAAPKRVVEQVAAIERAKVMPPVQVAALPVKAEPKAPTERQPLRAAVDTAPFAKRASWSVEGSF